MRKFLSALLVCVCMITTLVGCNEAQSNKTNTDSRSKTEKVYSKDLSGYNRAKFNDYNSPASENGLYGDLIFIEGTIESIDKNDEYYFMIIITEEDEKWACGVDSKLKSEIESLEDLEVKAYGAYLGYSGKYEAPGIYTEIILHKEKYYEAEYMFDDTLPEETSSDSELDSLNTSEESISTETKVDVLGSRKNPVPFNTDFTTEYVKYSHSGETRGYGIKISEILRGAEAEAIAVEANQFNAGKVPEGKDLILFKVDFTLNKLTVEESFLCSSIYFKYFSSSFGEENTFISIAGIDRLHAELYEGGSTSGWLYTLADTEDSAPLARFDEMVWLALYK